MSLAAAAHPAAADPADHTWCRTQSASFELISDLDLGAAAELAIELERFRVAATALVEGEDPLDPVPLKVIVFRSPKDFVRVFGHEQIAGFMQPSLDEHMLIFGPDRNGRGLRRIAFHEYTHFLFRSRREINYPIWYEEGFANLLATLKIEADGSAAIGTVEARALRQAVRTRWLPLTEILDSRHGLDWNRHDLPRLYQKALAFVHMLSLGHLDGGPNRVARIDELLARIDAGASSREAVESVLGETVADLEGALRDYVKRRRLPQGRIEVPVAHPPAPTQACLERDQAHYVLALATIGHNPDYATELIDSITARSPEDVALMVAASRAHYRDRGVSYEWAKRALDADGAHPGANVRMAQLAMATCMSGQHDFCTRDWADAAAMYRRALRHPDARVDAAYGLGIVYLHTGQPGDAVNYLRVAYQRAPWAPRINFYLGEAYRLTGERRKARKHLRKTLHWDPVPAWRDRANMALSLVGPVTPPPPSPQPGVPGNSATRREEPGRYSD